MVREHTLAMDHLAVGMVEAGMTVGNNGAYLAVPFITGWLSTAAAHHWIIARRKTVLNTEQSGQNRAETVPIEVETDQKPD